MKVKGDRDRRKKGRGRAKKVKREREIPCNRTDRTERELPSCVCVRWLVGTRGWKRNRSLIYCIIRSRFTRAHLHPTLISLSPAPYFPFYSSSSRETTATRITISGERVETGRERAEREGGRDIEGWQEGTCAGFVRQRGSWFEWSYATWLEILSNLRLHITWQQRCARLQIEPASVAGRSRESEDDYKRWYVSMNVAITFSLEYYAYTYPPPATFQTVTRGDQEPNKNSSLLFSLSKEALRVSAFLCDQPFTAFPPLLLSYSGRESVRFSSEQALDV